MPPAPALSLTSNVNDLPSAQHLIRLRRVPAAFTLRRLLGSLLPCRSITHVTRKSPRPLPPERIAWLAGKTCGSVGLTPEEWEILKSQNVTSSWGGRRKLPLVFTEQGVAMLSSVLNSETAIDVNIQIIRVFTKMRELLAHHKDLLLALEKLRGTVSHNSRNIKVIFNHLKRMEQEEENRRLLAQVAKKRPPIGFKKGKDKS
ncbi:MAG: ORF6N domain-containing protein [Bacteroidetes bacterium]|nr:ORF6N domain-containing protein [Bacteroidota bacterium]MBS1945469.1 ORF6N domain-containing protein [Bacteroidota bacterium]